MGILFMLVLNIITSKMYFSESSFLYTFCVFILGDQWCEETHWSLEQKEKSITQITSPF